MDIESGVALLLAALLLVYLFMALLRPERFG
jgi:K+-transporting ATPase KdpF subunit